RLFEHGDEAGDGGLLLSDGDVDAVERTIVLVAGRFRVAVQASLTDDRIDTDRRLAGGAIADDQLALPAPDRNHRVDRHDAGLHRLTDRTAPHDSRRDFFHWIRTVARDRALAVDRLSQRIHDAPEEPFANGHLQQPAGAAHLVALFQPCVVAEDDDTHFGLVEAQRQPGDAVTEIEHLVQ